MRLNFISRAWAVTAVTLLLLLMATPHLRAAEDQGGGLAASLSAESGNPLLDPDTLNSKIAELEAGGAANDQLKGALDAYKAALTQIKSSQRDEIAAARFKESIDQAAERKLAIEKQLLSVREALQQPSRPVTGVSLADLELRLDQAEADRNLIQNTLSGLEARQTNERLRPEQITDEVSQAKRQLQQVEEKLKNRDLGGAATDDTRRITLLATAAALRSRINRLEMERLSHSSRMEQLKAQVTLVKEQQSQAEVRLLQLQKQLSAQRSQEADQAAEEAKQVERAASDKHPLIKQAAEENARLGDQLSQVAESIEQALQRSKHTRDLMDLVEQNLARAIKQLDIPRFDDSLGVLLRAHHQSLPDEKKLRRRKADNERKLAKVRLSLFKVEDEKQQLLSDSDEPLVALGLSDDPAALDKLDPQQRAALKQELDKLYQDRLALLDKQQTTYRRLEKTLNNLDIDMGRLIGKVAEYRELLDRNLVWMPSMRPLSLGEIREDIGKFGQILAAVRELPIADRIQQVMSNRPLISGVVVLLVVVMLLLRRRLLRVLAEMAPLVGNVSRDSFLLTLRATLATLLLALPWVLLVGAAGGLLRGSELGLEKGLGELLLWVALYFSLLQTGRYLFIDNGLALVHFRWSKRSAQICRRSLRWFVYYSLPLVVIAGLLKLAPQSLGDGIARLLNMTWLLGLGLFAHQMLNRRSGLFVRNSNKSVSIFSWRALGYLLALGMVLFLFGLQVQGYNYTANRFGYLITASLWVGLLVLLLYSLAVRWLLVAARRMALAQARARRLAVQEARAAKEAAEAAGESAHELPELEEVNLATINDQTRNLAQVAATLVMVTALVLIWSQLTPAIGRLDDIILWQHLAGETGKQTLVPVSVWDVSMNLLVLVLTIVAARNLPGLLEIAILQPLDLEPGARYAFSRVSNYVIYTVGVLIAFSMVGVRWGDVQWLVAAMGVGLGFGLQEIFANFISGLMILFERPIRIGDTVTIGDISGTVSRIRIRATTITDWDNKELIVPNKSFITDPLINWTLSDPITRVVINVGIAYGSDTEKAHRILSEVVASNPDVMDDPKATVFFTGFGDSSLDFEIRVFVRDRIKRMPLLHELHLEIYRALNRADIEIPFPQRDLHLRSVDPAINLGTGGSPAVP